MFESYHAHVYYDPATRAVAQKVRDGLGKQFRVTLGRWHDAPVGPHPTSMYQVAFHATEFPKVVPWLMEHRGGLTVLVHPNSGDDYGDHAHRAIWMGKVLRLKLAFLKKLKR